MLLFLAKVKNIQVMLSLNKRGLVWVCASIVIALKLKGHEALSEIIVSQAAKVSANF